MVKYVLIDPRNTKGGPTAICLIDKAGHILGLNLVGGHVEDGETYAAAARRELKEETGYTPEDDILDRVGLFEGHDFEIALFTGPVENNNLPFNTDLTEPVYWFDWDTIRLDDRLQVDLKIIVPLIREAPPGWIVTQRAGENIVAFDPQRAFQTE